MVAGDFFKKNYLLLRQIASLTSIGKCKEHKTTSSGQEVKAMNKTRNRSPADQEAIEVLIAISHVSARLAGKLAALSAQRQSEEGGKTNEQDERYGTDHRRAPQCCCRY